MKNFLKTSFFFFWRALALVSLVLGLGLEHSCPWPRECLSSERLSLALALASDFFCVLGLGLGLEPCVLDSTSGTLVHFHKNLVTKLAGLGTFRIKIRHYAGQAMRKFMDLQAYFGKLFCHRYFLYQ